MKLLATIEAERMPLRPHFLAASVIKSALTISNPQLKDQLYDFSEHQSNKTMKPFSGAIYLNDYTVEKQQLLIHKNVQLLISSPDAEFILYVYNGLVQQAHYTYQQYPLHVQSVKILPEKLPKTNRALFKTLSPLIIKNHNNKYLDITHPDYEQELNYAANECIKSLQQRGLYEKLTFTPVLMHKKVVQLQHEKFAKLNEKSTLYMNAYEGSFLLEGHPADLALLTQSGLGFRRSLLFGAIELVHE